MMHSTTRGRLPAGLGIYPLGSLLNHACNPNAIQSFDGRELRFRVIRPIRAGQEITVPYMDLAMTRAERRLCLHLRYFFDIGPVRIYGVQSHSAFMSMWPPLRAYAAVQACMRWL